MEWLKSAVGEELYTELDSNGSIEKMKKAFGDTEYIPHDKDKWIEKHVFNSQRTELKGLKTKLSEYESELNNRKDLITSDEHKLKLLDSEKAFNAKILQMEETYKAELAHKEKENLMLNLLTTSGCKKPKYIMNSINYDDVLVKDGVIQNSKELVDGYKADIPEIFNTHQQSSVPNRGQGNSLTTKEQLIEQYNKSTSVVDKMAIQRRIKELDIK